MLRDSWQQSAEEMILSFDQGIRADFVASGNRVPFLQAGLDLLSKRFQSVGWYLPGKLSFPELRVQLEKLLNKNRLFKGSLIRLIIVPVLPSRELDGSPDFTYIASTEETEADFFLLNTKGLSVGISSSYRNTGEPLYSSMVRSRVRNLLILQEALLNHWDDILIPDHHGFLSEASNSTLFIRKKELVVTPAPENNCFPRAISLLIPEWIRNQGLRFEEHSNISPDDLKHADELFLADDLKGIRWVLSYENKRFYRKLSATLSEILANRMRTLDQFHIGSSG
jgi:branched-chain amino acid aminotransferase